jgi:hypothetical protein
MATMAADLAVVMGKRCLLVLDAFFAVGPVKKYAGWLRTVTSTIPSEEVVKSVIQQEYYHNFRYFRDTAIYRIIMSKSKKPAADLLPLAA